jgi:4-amino-4-deoxy-L-arabinose transferase-like glycosyltransferase
VKKFFENVRLVARAVVIAPSCLGIINLIVMILTKAKVGLPEFLQTDMLGKPIDTQSISWNLIVTGILLAIIFSKKYGIRSLISIVFYLVLAICWESSANTKIESLAIVMVTICFLMVILYYANEIKQTYDYFKKEKRSQDEKN